MILKKRCGSLVSHLRLKIIRLSATPNHLCGLTKTVIWLWYQLLQTPDGTSLTYNPRVPIDLIRLSYTNDVYENRNKYPISIIGFYRVNYDTENWMALIKQLKETPTDIHVLNRAQLISDSFNLARAGQLNYTIALELTKYLKNEDSTTPWYSAMQGFSYLLQRMPRSEKVYDNLKVFKTYKY